MTWLNEKIQECKHSKCMGSAGGMFAFEKPDGSIRPALVYSECNKCGWAYVGREMPPFPSEGEQEMIDLINSFHNIRYDDKNGN